MLHGGIQRFFSRCLALVAVAAVFPAFPVTAQALTVPIGDSTQKSADFAITLPWAQGVEHKITGAYGEGEHVGTDRACCNNDYYALDFDLTLDEPVFPVAPGVVLYAGPASGGEASYGNIVVVDHLNGYQSLYAHLNSVFAALGESVAPGTALGGAGGTGGWTAHLHFSLYQGATFSLSVLGGTGVFGGRAMIPEPFSQCSKANAQRCDGLATGDHLINQANVQLNDLARGPVTLSWNSPPDTQHFHLRVVPLHDDGPGVDLIISDPAQVNAQGFSLLPPVAGRGNYVLLPGASYSWQVRFSSASNLYGAADESWGPWSTPLRFQTALPDAKSIMSLSPAPASTINDPAPTLQWRDLNTSNFYYEVQVSRDSRFRLGNEAVAPVYWVLVHGGISEPYNSWTIPDEFRLAPGTYYVRLRQRLQATPKGTQETGIVWSAATSFTVNP